MDSKATSVGGEGGKKESTETATLMQIVMPDFIPTDVHKPHPPVPEKTDPKSADHKCCSRIEVNPKGLSPGQESSTRTAVGLPASPNAGTPSKTPKYMPPANDTKSPVEPSLEAAQHQTTPTPLKTEAEQAHPTNCDCSKRDKLTELTKAAKPVLVTASAPSIKVPKPVLVSARAPSIKPAKPVLVSAREQSAKPPNAVLVSAREPPARDLPIASPVCRSKHASMDQTQKKTEPRCRVPTTNQPRKVSGSGSDNTLVGMPTFASKRDLEPDAISYSGGTERQIELVKTMDKKLEESQRSANTETNCTNPHLKKPDSPSKKISFECGSPEKTEALTQKPATPTTSVLPTTNAKTLATGTAPTNSPMPTTQTTPTTTVQDEQLNKLQ